MYVVVIQMKYEMVKQSKGKEKEREEIKINI